MAETLYTADGKAHVLLGATTLVSLARAYMGDDAASRVDQIAAARSRALRDAEEDFDRCERQIDHWAGMAQNWLEELTAIRQKLLDRSPRAYSRRAIAQDLYDLILNINSEL